MKHVEQLIGNCVVNGNYVKLGVFAVGKDGGTPIWSYDGVTWTAGTGSTASSLKSSGSASTSTSALVVMVSGSQSIKSTDGKSWSLIDGTGIKDLATGGVYNNTPRVWANYDANTVQYTGGTSWSTGMSIDNFVSGKPAFGNGVLVVPHECASGDKTLPIWYSTDGGATRSATSTTYSEATYGKQWACAYLNGSFVMLFSDGYYSTSTNGSTWTTPAKLSGITTIERWDRIGYGNDVYVLIRRRPNSGSNVGITIFSSTSLSGTWTERYRNESLITDNTTHHDEVSVAYGNGTFVVVCHKSSTSVVLTSPNGTSWTQQSSSLFGACIAVEFLSNPM